MSLDRLRRSLAVVSLTLLCFSGSVAWASSASHQKALEDALARANAAKSEAEVDAAIQQLQQESAAAQDAPEKMHQAGSQKNILAIAGGVAGLAQIPALAGFGHPVLLLVGSIAVIAGIVLWLKARADHANAEAVKDRVSQAGQVLARLKAEKGLASASAPPTQGVQLERSGKGKLVTLPGRIVIRAKGDVIVNVGGGTSR